MQFYIADQPPFLTVSYDGGTYLQVDEAQLTNTVGGNLFLARDKQAFLILQLRTAPALLISFRNSRTGQMSKLVSAVLATIRIALSQVAVVTVAKKAVSGICQPDKTSPVTQ
jgi:hypothetical protein